MQSNGTRLALTKLDVDDGFCEDFDRMISDQQPNTTPWWQVVLIVVATLVVLIILYQVVKLVLKKKHRHGYHN